jgi:hypothetical protein
MAVRPENRDIAGGGKVSDTGQPGEAEEAVAVTREAVELSKSDEGVLHSMMESYDHALADQERFMERNTDADRRPVTGRALRRPVRVATAAERREGSAD